MPVADNTYCAKSWEHHWRTKLAYYEQQNTFYFYNIPVLSPQGDLQNGSPISSKNTWKLKNVICLAAKIHVQRETAFLPNQKIDLLTVPPFCIS